MYAPKVEESVKEQIRQEYAEFDLGGLLEAGQTQHVVEESKNLENDAHKYPLETSMAQIYSLVAQA